MSEPELSECGVVSLRKILEVLSFSGMPQLLCASAKFRARNSSANRLLFLFKGLCSIGTRDKTFMRSKLFNFVFTADQVF